MLYYTYSYSHYDSHYYCTYYRNQSYSSFPFLSLPYRRFSLSVLVDEIGLPYFAPYSIYLTLPTLTFAENSSQHFPTISSKAHAPRCPRSETTNPFTLNTPPTVPHSPDTPVRNLHLWHTAPFSSPLIDCLILSPPAPEYIPHFANVDSMPLTPARIRPNQFCILAFWHFCLIASQDPDYTTSLHKKPQMILRKDFLQSFQLGIRELGQKRNGYLTDS